MILLKAAKTVLHSAWFCPFAQRAWIALNELGISYELVESLTIDPQTEVYIKSPELLQLNPKGLVPTLVQTDEQGEIFENCDSLEILRDLYLLQDDADDKRVLESYSEAIDWNRRICSQFYQVLMRQDGPESEAAWCDMKQSLHEFSEHLHSGFYNSAQDKPGLVDICVFPFVHRLYLIQHYKGFDCSISPHLAEWEKLMESRPFVQHTLAPRDELVPIYLPYADGTAKSKVAESVRQGKQAHNV